MVEKLQKNWSVLLIPLLSHLMHELFIWWNLFLESLFLKIHTSIFFLRSIHRSFSGILLIDSFFKNEPIFDQKSIHRSLYCSWVYFYNQYIDYFSKIDESIIVQKCKPVISEIDIYLWVNNFSTIDFSNTLSKIDASIVLVKSATWYDHFFDKVLTNQLKKIGQVI